MTQDDIIRMAREVWGVDDWKPTQVQRLERFAALVAAHERDECAKLAESTVCDTHLPTGVKIHGSQAAKAIRARGQA